MKQFLPLVTLTLLLLTGCEKEIFETGTDVDAVPIFVTSAVSIPVEDTDENFTVDYRPVTDGNFFDNVGAIGTLSTGALGPTLFLGLFDQPGAGNGSARELFTLQFWPDELPDPATVPQGSLVATDDLRAMFPAGRVLPFGTGPGKVEFSLALEPPGLRTGLSRSSFAGSPEGELTVESVFPWFSRTSEATGERQQFWLVRFNFTGRVGVFDRDDFFAAEQAGIPYRSKSVADVTGTGNLVLQAVTR